MVNKQAKNRMTVSHVVDEREQSSLFDLYGNRIATVIGDEHERGVGRGDGDVVRAPTQGGFRRVRRPVARSASAAGAPCSVEP